MRIEAAPHAKAHTRYTLADGTPIPGVTTVIGQLDKPFLKTWANNLGLEGYEVGPYTEAQARVGTLGHALIAAELQGVAPDVIEDYSPDEYERAKNVLQSFKDWRSGHDLQPILVEESLVSEARRFGGQIDLYASLNGKKGIIDLKTSNDIHDEHKTQVCTYAKLLEENGHDIDFAMLLRLPRGGGTAITWTTIRFNARFDLFLCLLDVYNGVKAVKADEEAEMPVAKSTRKKQASVTISLGAGDSKSGGSGVESSAAAETAE